MPPTFVRELLGDGVLDSIFEGAERTLWIQVGHAEG